MGPLKNLRLRERPIGDGPPPRNDGLDLVNRDNRIFIRDSDDIETGILVETGTPVDSVARVLTLNNGGVVIDGEVFAIGGWYFEINASDGVTVSNVGASGVAAVGTINLTGAAVAAGTLTINSQAYTFRAIADYDAAFEIGVAPATNGLTGGDLVTYSEYQKSIWQAHYIAAALNGTDGINAANSTVSARASGATVILTARNIGSGGDAVTVTESAANLGLDSKYILTGLPTAGQTFLTDTGVTYTFRATADFDAAFEVELGDTAAATAINMARAINGTDGVNAADASVTAQVSGSNVILTEITGDGTVSPTAGTSSNMTYDSGTMGNTTAGVDPQYYPIDITSTAIKSVGTLTISGSPSIGDTLIVGASTYTLVAAASATGEITIGANVLDMSNKIIAAVNGDSFNTANVSCSADGGGAGQVVITALVGGAAGENIVLDAYYATNISDDGSGNLGGTTTGVDSTAANFTDAVVTAFAALNASIDLPFTAVDATNDVTITSTLHGTVPNDYITYENSANIVIDDTTAGVDGTPGQVGTQMQDGTNLYTLNAAVAANEDYTWFKVAHAAL